MSTSTGNPPRTLEKIDEDVTSMNATVLAIRRTQQKHGERLNNHGTMLTDIQAKVGVIKRDVKDIKADVSGLKSDMVEVKADITGLKADVAELKTDVSGLKTDVSGLKTDMVDVKTMLGVIISRLPER